MDPILLALLLAVALHLYNRREQRRRIVLLATELRPWRIEPLMENLTEGYLRALGESDPARREQVWQHLDGVAHELADQFGRFAEAYARLDAAATRASRLPVALPLAERLPGLGFDTRELMRMHARGIARLAAGDGPAGRRDRAYMLTAELYLMQHSCHWYCRSRAVASARLLARHQTSHAQVLAAVSPDTRVAYRALTGL